MRLWRIAAVDHEQRLALEIVGVDDRGAGEAMPERNSDVIDGHPRQRHAGDAVDLVDRSPQDADREPSGHERFERC